MINLKKSLNNLLYLFYPEMCAACNKALYDNEKYVCSPCKLKLPYTNAYKVSPSAYNRVFWGKLPIVEVWPLWVYQKKTGVQNILHQIKYKNNPEPAKFFAKYLALEVKKHLGVPLADTVIPVPMHPQKEQERGYNQADYIAQGLSEVWNIETNKDLVIKTAYTKTQTKKDRFSRFSNYEEIFKVVKPEKVRNLKGVIIADDVITTGATIENLAKTLLIENPDLLIYVATLAAA